MRDFFGMLAVLALGVAGVLAYAVRKAVLALRHEPVWHPGDDLPEIPEDATIRRGFGGRAREAH